MTQNMSPSGLKPSKSLCKYLLCVPLTIMLTAYKLPPGPSRKYEMNSTLSRASMERITERTSAHRHTRTGWIRQYLARHDRGLCQSRLDQRPPQVKRSGGLGLKDLGGGSLRPRSALWCQQSRTVARLHQSDSGSRTRALQTFKHTSDCCISSHAHHNACRTQKTIRPGTPGAPEWCRHHAASCPRMNQFPHTGRKLPRRHKLQQCIVL